MTPEKMESGDRVATPEELMLAREVLAAKGELKDDEAYLEAPGLLRSNLAKMVEAAGMSWEEFCAMLLNDSDAKKLEKDFKEGMNA